MYQRWILAVIATQLGGCAWLFQDKLPNGYDGYHGRSAPQCSTGSGWAVVDGIFAGLSTVSALTAGADDTNPNQGLYIGSGVAWTIIHMASAISGSGWAKECQRANADWDSGTTTASSSAADARDVQDARDERERLRLERALARRQREEAAATPPPRPRPAASAPRGFYCTSSAASPAAGLCTRAKDDCARGRSIVVGAVPDLGACALIEAAHCFDAGSGDQLERCAPSADACAAQHAAAAASPGAPSMGDCVEQL